VAKVAPSRLYSSRYDAVNCRRANVLSPIWSFEDQLRYEGFGGQGSPRGTRSRLRRHEAHTVSCKETPFIVGDSLSMCGCDGSRVRLPSRVHPVGRLSAHEMFAQHYAGSHRRHAHCAMATCIVVLLGLVLPSAAQSVDVNCSLIGSTPVDVPAGATYVARCQHDATDPTYRIQTTAAIQVQFRCNPGSTVIFDGWRQLNGSLDIMPGAGSNTLEQVRIDTRNEVTVESTFGHALSFVAAFITNCSLIVGDGTHLQGFETAGSFITTSVSHSSIAVGVNCIVSTSGYAAAAVVVSGPGDGQLDMTNVSLSSQSGSAVRARGKTPGRLDYVSSLGATAGRVSAVDSVIAAHGSIIEAEGRDGVASAGFAAVSNVINSVHMTGSCISANSSHVVARGVTAVASVGVALNSGSSSEVQAVGVQVIVTGCNVTATGVGVVASVGIAGRSTGGSSATINAGGATFVVNGSNVTAYGTGLAVASGGLAATGITSSFAIINCVGASFRFQSSDVGAFGVSTVASGGVSAFSAGSAANPSIIDAVNASFIAELSNVTVRGDSYAVAALGLASYSTRCPITINAMGAQLIVVSTRVAVFGYRVIANAGFAAYTLSNSLDIIVNLTRAEVVVSSSNISASGNAIVASVGVAINKNGGACDAIVHCAEASIGVNLSNISATGDADVVVAAGVSVLTDSDSASRNSINATGATVSVTSSNVTVSGLRATGCVCLVIFGGSTSTINADNVRLSSVSSNVTSIGTDAVVAVALSVISPFGQDVSVRAAGSSFVALSSNITASGGRAVASVGIALYGGTAAVNVTRSYVLAQLSNVTVAGTKHAAASAGFAAYGIVSSIVNAAGIVLISKSCSISCVGSSTVASVGFTIGSDTGTTAVNATGATLRVFTSRATAIGSEAVATLSVVSRGGTSRVDAGGARLSAWVSSVNAAGSEGVASMGVLLSSNAANYLDAPRAQLIATISNVTAYGVGPAVASVGFAGFTVLATSAINISGTNVSIAASNVTAQGTKCVAAAAIASVGTTGAPYTHLDNFAVTVCSSSVATVGQYFAAAAGVATTFLLTSSNVALSVSGSVLALECFGAASCGQLAALSFVATSMDFYTATSGSNRVSILDSTLTSPSFCANLGNAAVFDGVLIANATFYCGVVGWAETNTSRLPWHRRASETTDSGNVRGTAGVGGNENGTRGAPRTLHRHKNPSGDVRRRTNDVARDLASLTER
jgi:hypothetical protein